jgi:energy-coupling factor transport system permease protein
MQGNKFPGAPPGPNWVRRLDPRTKLFLLAASFAMVLLPQSPGAVALATLVVLAHVTLAGTWGALRPIRWLLVPLALFSLGVWSFLAHGPTPLVWGVSRESLAFGAANFLKLATMMVAGLTLLATTPAEELFQGLVDLRVPYPGAFAFALALRWVPEVFATAMRVKEAQAARGLSWGEGGPLDRLKRHLPLLVPIFLLTLRRSQAMAWALEARGFQMSPRRTYLLSLHMSARDWLVLGVAGLLLAGFITLHLLHGDRIPGLTI